MMSPFFRKLLALYTAVICVTAVAPILIVLSVSFTATDFLVFPPQGLSLKWFYTALERPEYLQSALLSLTVAALVSLIATICGTMAALVLYRHQFFGATALREMFLAPLALPGLMIGLSLLQYAVFYRGNLRLSWLIFGHVIIVTPFVIRFVTTALMAMPQNLERAGASLGAGPVTVFRLVTFPMIRAGMIAAVAFTFILSFDEVAISLFVSSGQQTTLPVRIFLYYEQSFDPLAAAVSTLMVALAAFLIAIIEKTVGIARLFGIDR